MNRDLLRKHIAHYRKHIEANPLQAQEDGELRRNRREYYQSFSRSRLLEMTEDELHEYIAKLWAMLIWGNKRYVTDKLLEDNGLDGLRKELADLVWGGNPVAERWDRFRKRIKGMGPAMMSEILCHVHPDSCMLWNRRALVGLRYLGVENLPRYDYQMTGRRYAELSEAVGEIAQALRAEGFEDADLLTADYFIWEELQAEGSLAVAAQGPGTGETLEQVASVDQKTSEFIHDEIRDKLVDIGMFLGLAARPEVKVADGSKVDAVWEQTIGNMGRVIYVFEVQTKGSIDSLVVNLLKSLNNPAVQGVVAVSDTEQIEKIRKHAAEVQGLGNKLKCWDYERVLEVHEALQSVNAEINSLGLVPSGF